LLHRLKHARGDRRLMAFRRAVDDPDFVGIAPQIGAHLLKSVPLRKPATVMKQITPCCGVTGGVSGVMMLPPNTFQVAHRQN
jgi:hypothetical protein